MATNLRQSLQERARQANIGGDIRLGQYHRGKRSQAEAALSSVADSAKNVAGKTMKGGKLLDAAKFISSFFGPTGQLVSAGLNLVDVAATGKATKNWQKEIKKKGVPSSLKGTIYENYYKQNLDALKSQVSQSLGSRRKANLLGELVGSFTKTANMPFATGTKSKLEALSNLNLPAAEE